MYFVDFAAKTAGNRGRMDSISSHNGHSRRTLLFAASEMIAHLVSSGTAGVWGCSVCTGDLNYWSCSSPQIMATLNPRRTSHHLINTGIIWTCQWKLQMATFQMDTYLEEAFVLWKKTWLAISQVHEDFFFFAISEPPEIAPSSVKGLPSGQKSGSLCNRWSWISIFQWVKFV